MILALLAALLVLGSSSLTIPLTHDVWVSPSRVPTSSPPGSGRTDLIAPAAASVVSGLPTEAPPTACPRAGSTIPPGGPCVPSGARSPIPATGWNSTPVPELGSRLGTVIVGSVPYGIAYDSKDGNLYAANFNAGTVSVINRTMVIRTVSVGVDPVGVAYDPKDGYVYVANSGSNSVSVLSGGAFLTNVALLSTPFGVAVDPGTGFVYVSDSGSGKVSILRGTSIVATITVGTSPLGMAYDSGNGDVYVADNASNAVGVINGTTVVASIPVGTAPVGVGYNPTRDYVYVSDQGASNVSVISGTSVVKTIPVGSGPNGIGYDGANGFTYVANEGSGNVSVINGTKVTASIGVPSAPLGVAYNPGAGAIYVTCSGAAVVQILSTLLAESAVVASEHGRLVDTTDALQNLTFTASVWALGSGGLVVSYKVAPSPGFGCAGSVAVDITNGIENLSIACTPPTPGIYSLWLNVTDSIGSHAWGTVNIAVDSALVVPAPTISAVFLAGSATAEVGQTVGFSANPSGGSGVYNAYLWVGIPTANCTGAHASQASCRFPSAGIFSVYVQVNDTNGATSQSPASSVTIYAALVAARPVANRTSADVNQSVRFSEFALGGPGTFVSFAWTIGGAARCSAGGTSRINCSFPVTGTFTVGVTVLDSDQATSTSASLLFRVLGLPIVSDPQANRTFADVGQNLAFSTNATGGAGNYSYSWSGLPLHCLGADTARPRCVLSDPGPLVVWPTVVDGNGGSSTSSSPVSVAVYPAPSLGAPSFSSGTIALGDSLGVSVTVTGGSGSYVYNWSGLPPGCAGTGRSFSCTPKGSGSFAISVIVTDSSGLRVTSAPSTVTVQPSLVPFGLSLPVFSGVVGGAVALAVLGFLLFRRRRRRSAGQQPLDEEAAPEVDAGALPDDETPI